MSAGLIAFSALAVTVLVQAAGLLIWGASLTQRVKRLEDEIEPLKALPAQMAVLQARLDGVFEQLRDLNASVRWMREPAEYGIRPGGK